MCVRYFGCLYNRVFLTTVAGQAAILKIIRKGRLSSEAIVTFFSSLLLITISFTTSLFKQTNFFNTTIPVKLKVILPMLINFTNVILIPCVE